MQEVRYNGENYEEYVASLLRKEEEHLRIANIFSIERQYYGNERDTVATFALPTVRMLAGSVEEPLSILEIGAGKGNATKLLKRTTPDLQTAFTITSLLPLPEHRALQEEGVMVLAPQIAEKLPEDWQWKFHIVLTQSVMGWTNLDYSIPEILRVLVCGGYWCGLESAGAHAYGTRTEVRSFIESEMRARGYENLYENIYAYRKLHDEYPLLFCSR